MSEPRVLPTREGYDRWAASYDTMGNWLLALEEPEVDRALGDVADLDVLDVGAGTGRHAIRLAARGARVTAVDFSEEMLAKARVKQGAKRVRWMTHDVGLPLPFADHPYARVLSALVLEHIPPARLTPFFSELGRVTLPDGRIVVTAMHPAMFVKGTSANFRDEAGAEIRPQSYPATLSDYTTAAVNAGLGIDRLAELVVDDAVAARNERAARWVGWPALLGYRAPGRVTPMSSVRTPRSQPPPRASGPQDRRTGARDGCEPSAARYGVSPRSPCLHSRARSAPRSAPRALRTNRRPCGLTSQAWPVFPCAPKISAVPCGRIARIDHLFPR